jgi:L-phenylalanine/L-methionine N-acetyltransferase
VTFVIRAARPGDAAELVRLADEIGAEPEGWLIAERAWRSVGEERRYLRTIARYPHAAVFVAESDGRVVGRLSLARDPHPASAHVADLGLMVAPEHRRQGIGRALMDTAFEWARASGVRKLELHVFPHNTPALALYDRLGFEREGVRKGHYARGQQELDAILMARRVE